MCILEGINPKKQCFRSEIHYQKFCELIYLFNFRNRNILCTGVCTADTGAICLADIHSGFLKK